MKVLFAWLLIALAVFFTKDALALDFMGITMGDKFAMPECIKKSEYSYMFDSEQSVRPCYKKIGQKNFDPSGTFNVDFLPSKDKAPVGSMKSSPTVTVIDGVYAGVRTFTTGLRFQSELFSALKAKYGKPSESSVEEAQNRMGAKFQRIVAEWRIDGGRVSFIGLINLDSGGIRVLSAEGLRAEEKKKKETKPSSF